MTYAEQLKHPEWQKRRLEIMKIRNFECEECGDKETTLNVHHKRYRKGSKIWEYSDEELSCLCQDCHKSAHDFKDNLESMLVLLSVADMHLVVGYIKALSTDKELAEGYQFTSEEEFAGACDYFRLNEHVPVIFEAYKLDNLYKIAQMIHGGRFNRRRG